MLYLSIGNTFDHALLAGVHKLNQSSTNVRITELFGSLRDIGVTCRSGDRLPAHDMKWLEGYVQMAKNLDLELSWTLNANCIGSTQEFESTWRIIRHQLTRLWEMGVDRYVIAHPLIVELVHNEFPDAYIEVSTVAEVDSVEKVSEFHARGANAICGKLSLNRNFRALRALVACCVRNNMRYRFILNELCLRDCIDRTSCYLLSSHDSARGPFDSYPFKRCSDIRRKDPSQWIRSPFILPQWLPAYYTQLGSENLYGKVVGRTSTTSKVLEIAAHYCKTPEPYAGNLLDLWPGIEYLANRENPTLPVIMCSGIPDGFLDEFMERGHVCNLKSCSKCGHCAIK